MRGQSWVVARVEPAPPTSGRAATLVHLQSVADGRFGDTLSVIWEVEPGRRILDRGSLPDASTGQYDPPSRLAAFLDAVRWSAVASADVKTLQAPFRSGVAVEPYQYRASGRDLLLTQRLMRHASPATTAGYAAVADDQIHKVAASLPGADPTRKSRNGEVGRRAANGVSLSWRDLLPRPRCHPAPPAEDDHGLGWVPNAEANRRCSP